MYGSIFIGQLQTKIKIPSLFWCQIKIWSKFIL